MVRDSGVKVGGYMKKREVKYTKGEIGNSKIIPDFLPKPEDLILKEETQKVTILLTKSSVDFFKKEAKKNHTNYQKMIRSLIDEYTEHFKTVS